MFVLAINVDSKYRGREVKYYKSGGLDSHDPLVDLVLDPSKAMFFETEDDVYAYKRKLLIRNWTATGFYAHRLKQVLIGYVCATDHGGLSRPEEYY